MCWEGEMWIEILFIWIENVLNYKLKWLKRVIMSPNTLLPN